MLSTRTIFRRLAGAAVLFALAQPAGAQTWREYIKACRDAVGPVAAPKTLSCLAGEVLPITLDDKPIPATTDEDAKNFPNANKGGTPAVCDKPPLLSDVAGANNSNGFGQCVPNARILTGGSWDTSDGTGYVLLCRNYVYRSLDSQKGNPVFDDVAMIIYNRKNGASCFFQQLAKKLDRLPEVEIEEKPEAIRGDAVPFPLTDEEGTFWLPPQRIRQLRCVTCHSSYAFVRSPYVQQAKTTAPLPSPSQSRLYFFAGDKFQDDWQDGHGYFNITGIKDGENGACRRCHRLGPELAAGLMTSWSSGTPAPFQNPALDFDASHWMPNTPRSADTYEGIWRASVNEFVRCNEAFRTNPNTVPPECAFTALPKRQ